MYDVQPFKADDYPEAVEASFPWMPDPLAIGHELQRSGPAYTGRADGRIAVVSGVMIPWPGMGHGWAHVTEIGRRHGYFVHAAVVRHLRAIIADCRLQRVNADVVATFGPGRHWLEMMVVDATPRQHPYLRCSCGCGGLARGHFRLESLMPRYGPDGADFVRYRWIRPGS